MATKLKNIAHSAITKILVWMLLAGSVFVLSSQGIQLLYSGYDNQYEPESILISDYARSKHFRSICASSEYAIQDWLSDSQPTIIQQFNSLKCYFYATDAAGNILTNVADPSPEFFTSKKHWTHRTFSDGILQAEGTIPNFYQYQFFTDISSGSYYLAYEDAAFDAAAAQWTQARTFYLDGLKNISLGCLIALLALLYLIAAAGRRPNDDGLRLFAVDRLWSEITLGFLTLIGTAECGILALICDDIWSTFRSMDMGLAVVMGAVGTVACVLLFTALLLSVARKVKAHRFLKDCLTYKLLAWCWNTVKKVWHFLHSFFDASVHQKYPPTQALFRSQRTYILTSAILMLLALLFCTLDGYFIALVLLAGELLITVWYISGNQKNCDKINAGLDDSTQQQIKAESTKTALITNVSHDLKTPLTSIITYIDLLSQEEDLSDTARDYVQIIARKSEHLRHLVNDLFELTKSTTGNLQLEMERLDLNLLLEQTLADLKDSIDDAAVTVKPALMDHPVFIYSDGKKLYRVFQNLVDNALKYSMPGTRVFLSLTADATTATACIKNTASYEMDFTPNEILQRFVRGDQSRSGEGNGLGLSIAESFTQACGGTFQLDIDGDLFKVTIQFPVISENTADQGKEKINV